MTLVARDRHVALLAFGRAVAAVQRVFVGLAKTM
jgi:hypothetical protein